MAHSTAHQEAHGVPGDARISRWLGRGLIVLGCLVTLFAWQLVARRLGEDAQTRFVAFSEARELLFDRHVKRLTDVARSFQGLFLSSDDVSLDEFRAYFEILGLEGNLPEVRSVRYDQSERASVNAHQSVHYVAPADDEVPTGLQIHAPVYRSLGRNVDVLGTVWGHPESIQGRLSVAIDVGKLVANVMPEGVTLPYRVRCSDIGTADGQVQPVSLIFEGGGADASALMQWASRGPLGIPALDRGFVIEVGERLWALSLHREPMQPLLQPEALLVLLSGALGTLVLAMTLKQLQRRMDRSVETVQAMDRQAERDDARLRGVIDQSAEGIITFDAGGVVLTANPAALSLFRQGPLFGRSLFDLIEPGDHALLREHLRLQNGPDVKAAGMRIDLRALRADGTVFPLSMTCRTLVTTTASRGECMGTLRDLSVGQRAAAAMRKLSQYDAVTGLINREAFLKCLAEALERFRAEAASGHQVPLAMMIIDLDRFKKINETLGHLAGDRVLLEIAARLRGLLADEVTLARLGGDEFAVLLVAPQALVQIEALARQILKLLSDPLEVDGQRLRISGSIGITGVQVGDDMADVDGVTLMSQADSAMYLAKNAGRSQLHVHHREDHQHSPAQLQLEVDLHRALERNELELYFQPQFDCCTRALVGAEALLRWNHHGQGMVSPAQFIPLAEESGLIVPIGRWVLDEACRHARQWQDVAGRPITVAVNLASRQMVDDDIVSAVLQSLEHHALTPGLLELEITESAAVTDTEQARGLLNRLAALGVSVSIDDFGVGYSSLSYLRDLPVQRFKIDRSFLINVPQDAGSSRLVSAMISMARSLEVGLVAEGVETEAQLEFLAEQRCDVAQGYWLGKPVPAPEFMRRLREEWLIP